MPTTIRTVEYAYVTMANRPGEATRILEALRDANVNLLAFSGFPLGRNTAQIDVVTDNIDALLPKVMRQPRAPALAMGAGHTGGGIKRPHRVA